jgi:hypothetical protein
MKMINGKTGVFPGSVRFACRKQEYTIDAGFYLGALGGLGG